MDEILQDDPSLKQKWDELREQKEGGLLQFDEDDKYDEYDQTVSAQNPSGSWYLCPLLFGILRGIIAYVAVRDRNRGMSNGCLIFGFIMVFLEVFVLYPLLY